MNPLKALYRAFSVADFYVAWAFFLVGLIGFVLTMAGVLPPFGDNWFGRVVTSLGWLLVCKEGFNDIADYYEEEC